MTLMEFNFYILFNIIQKTAMYCVNWFNDLLFSSGGEFFYLSCITIFFFTKYLIRPIVGYSMHSGQSDTVKGSKRNKDN